MKELKTEDSFFVAHFINAQILTSDVNSDAMLLDPPFSDQEKRGAN
jgi:hypothetical protein